MKLWSIMEENKEIKEYWDLQAKINRDQQNSSNVRIIDKEKNVYGAKTSTLKDHNLRELEIRSICDKISINDKVLDLGCGDGYSTIEIAKRNGCNIVGIDISEEMIKNANKSLNYQQFDLQKKISFRTGTITNVTENFDKVITMRCLINIPTKDDQYETIQKIAKILNPEGKFLMLEGCMDGLRNLNAVRAHLGLDPIKVVWHNLFFEEEELRERTQKYFIIEKIDSFSSIYMLISRAVHPALKEPDYNSKINEIALQLSDNMKLGDYGYLKLFVFKHFN